MEVRQIDISVVIPTYNEAENLPMLVEKLSLVLKDFSYEIVVVDDNSPDKTWEVADNLSSQYPVRMIRRFTEKGLSSAVMVGMASSHGKIFTVIDADLQHDERIIPKMYDALTKSGADIAIGSRAVLGGSYGDWSKRRRFMSMVATTMAKTLLRVKITDPMSGFFSITRECFNKTAEKINPRGFKILLEFVGRNKDLKIKEIGYTFRNRVFGETKLSASEIRNYLIALYDIRFGKYIPPIFFLYSLVGVSGVFVNLSFFKLGEFLGFPRIYTGISEFIDPVYTAVPFGYQMAIFTNYYLNNTFTFYEKRKKGFRAFLAGFLMFQLVSLFGLFIQTGVFQLLHINGFLYGAFAEEWRALFNNACGIVVALVSNYYLNMNFTWGRRN